MAASVRAIFNMNDRISNRLDNVTRRTEKMQKAFKRLQKVALIAIAAIVTAVSGFAVSATADFIQFEGRMNEVFTLMPGITDQAMGEMTDQVKDFSREFAVLPEKVVPALYQSLSAGVPPDNVFDFLAVAQKAAIGGVAELETAVDGISSIVNAYGADVISAAQASDYMFTAVKLGKTNFEELSASLFNVIPSAAALGVEFGDVSAGLAAITAQGTPTSVATTQLRQMFVELSKAGGDTAETFEALSGKSFKQFIKDGGDVQDALQLLEKRAKRGGVGINDLFGSVEAGNAALGLTGKGTEKFTQALLEMEDAAGATDAAYERMQKGVGRSIDRIKANIKVLKLNIGEKFAPYVSKAADKINEKFDKMFAPRKILVRGEMVEGESAFDEYFDKIFAPRKILVRGELVEGDSAFEDFIQMVTSKFKEIGQVTREIYEVFFPNLSKAAQDTEVNFASLTENGLDLVITGLEWIRDNAQLIKAAIVGLTTAWIVQKGVLVGLALAQYGHIIASGIAKAADIAETIAIIALYGADYARGAALWTVAAAQGALNAVMLLSPTTWIIIGILALVAGLVLLYNKSETARRIMNAMWEGMKSGAETSLNFIIGKVNEVIGVLNKIKIPDWIPGIGGKGVNIKAVQEVKFDTPKEAQPILGDMPQYATGTDFHPGGPAIVGEKGPELINLPRGSQVTPAEETRQLLQPEIAPLEPLTQDITQNVIPAKDERVEELTQNVAQKIIPPKAAPIPQPEAKVDQEVIPANIKQPQDVGQSVIQKVMPAKIDDVEDLTQTITQNFVQGEMQQIEGAAQEINQVVNTANIKQPEELTHMVKQEFVEASIPQPGSMNQNILQKAKQANIEQPQDITQSIMQRILPTKAVQPEAMTQSIQQQLIQAEIKAPEDGTQNVIQKLIKAKIQPIKDATQCIIQKFVAAEVKKPQDTTQNVLQHIKEAEVRQPQGLSQEIIQTVAEAKIKHLDDITQSIVQNVIPARIVQPEYMQQSIVQKVAKAAAPGPENLTQNIFQKVIPAKLRELGGITQDIIQKIIPAKFERLNNLTQNITQKVIKDNSVSDTLDKIPKTPLEVDLEAKTGFKLDSDSKQPQPLKEEKAQELLESTTTNNKQEIHQDNRKYEFRFGDRVIKTMRDIEDVMSEIKGQLTEDINTGGEELYEV